MTAHRLFPRLLVVSLLMTVTVATGLSVGIVAATIELTAVDAPSGASAGDSVRVSATAQADESLDNEIELSLFRLDTGEKLCTSTGGIPGMAMCSETFTMPDQDVEIKAVLRFATGGTIDTQTTTITATDPETPTPTPTPTPPSTPDPDADPETPTPQPPTTTATPLPENSTDRDDDGEGLLTTIVDGLSSAAKTDWKHLLNEVLLATFFTPFLYLAQQLIKMLAAIVVWTPAVHPNPPVQEVHQQTFIVSTMLSLAAFLVAGLLYQLGPLLGISYREVRLILPRLVVALIFGAISLPLLQLAIEFTNALVIAFKPATFETSMGGLIGTATVAVLVWVIDAVVLLFVVIIYLIRDFYILFVAAISPLIALAWALPFTRKYAQAFIAGFWTALAMGPLAMLVLTFVFALLTASGTGPLQSVGNWVFGVAGFVMLLIIPWQLYGASQAMVGQAFFLGKHAEHGVKHRYQQYRTQQERRTHRELDRAIEEEYGVDFTERGKYARDRFREKYREEYGDPRNRRGEP